MTVEETLQLLDWKRRVFALYALVRLESETDPPAAWARWRETRDELYREHPQSPLEASDRASFGPLEYFDYDPVLRLAAELRHAPETEPELPVSRDGPVRFRRFATVGFDLDGRPCELEAYWLDAYGGGLFLPFRDATRGTDTYGGGRYLLDTVKGADLGTRNGRVVLDFNFAYNPSCVYSSRWACPLASQQNTLEVPVRGGERLWWKPDAAA